MRALVRDGEFLIEDSIRHTWKEGRNLVFHYFPHNYRSLTRIAAVELVNQLVGTMSEAVLILAPK